MMKKLFVGFAAGAMVFALGTGGIFAAGEDTKTVDVIYDNSETITDPDDPNAANWGVKVPTAIQFTDTTKEVDADIELVGLNGYEISTMDKDVNVSVKSANGMELTIAGEDPVSYTLTYGATSVTGTTATTVNLKSASPKQAGTATMTGKATKKGLHKDIVTYVVKAVK